MTLLVSTLAVGFSAFCVWLTVRIVNRRERWAKWTAFWVTVSYPISFIVLRLASIYGRFPMPRAAKNLYGPILWLQQSIEEIAGILL